MARTPKEAIDQTLAELGRLVATWNHLEFSLSWLLEVLTEGGRIVRILGANMRHEALCHALRTITAEIKLDDELKCRIIRAIDAFERLREYRNHYTHNSLPTFGMSNDNSSAIMTTYSLKAKGKVVATAGGISFEQIKEAVDLCKGLQDYLSRLSTYLSTMDCTRFR
jgi:hypothetical protein